MAAAEGGEATHIQPPFRPPSSQLQIASTVERAKGCGNRFLGQTPRAASAEGRQGNASGLGPGDDGVFILLVHGKPGCLGLLGRFVALFLAWPWPRNPGWLGGVGVGVERKHQLRQGLKPGDFGIE